MNENKKFGLGFWLALVVLLGLLLGVVTKLIAQRAPHGDRFSIGRLNQAQLDSATRAPNGSALRKRYLKATCEQQLEGANKSFARLSFHSCGLLADLYARASVVTCSAELVLADLLPNDKVGRAPARPREAGELCLGTTLMVDGVQKFIYLVSLNCANPYVVQPPASMVAINTARVDTAVIYDTTRAFHNDTLVVSHVDTVRQVVNHSGKSGFPWKRVVGGAVFVGTVIWAVCAIEHCIQVTQNTCIGASCTKK